MSYYVGAYWGDRAESVTACAQCLADCLDRLAKTHVLLSTWYRKGRSKAAASRQQVDVSPAALESLLDSGRSRTDVGGEVITELGFSASLWNKNADDVSFSILCGATPGTSSIKNNFLLKLPTPSEVSAEVYDPAIAHRILMSVVEVWQPQWATFTSHALREQQNAEANRPVAGWQTFVATSTKPGVPSGVHVEDVSNGILLTAGPDPLHVSESQISAAAKYLENISQREV